MGDFLSRLIGRSTGEIAVARPVIAPLFGPDPGAGGAPEPLPPVPAPRGASAVPPAADSHNITTAPAERQPPPVPPEDIETAVAPAASWREVVATVAPPGQRDSSAPAEAAVLALASPVHSREEQRRLSVPVRAEAKAEAERTSPLPRTTHDNIAVRPRSQGRPLIGGSREHAAASRAEAEAAPVVIVNIGRIEVRTAMPPAPTPPPATRKPAAISLEEYLKPRPGSR